MLGCMLHLHLNYTKNVRLDMRIRVLLDSGWGLDSLRVGAAFDRRPTWALEPLGNGWEAEQATAFGRSPLLTHLKFNS